MSSDQQVGGLSPDARSVTIRDYSGSIQLADAASGNPIGEPNDAPITENMTPLTVAFSADGRWFTATGSGGDVRVWRTRADLPLGQRRDLASNFQAGGELHQTPSGQVVGVAQSGDVTDVRHATSHSAASRPPRARR